jgi:fatty-acyl-CoA synthase
MLASATPYRPDVMEFDENAVAEIFYTSGTSASPKGVMLTHRNIYLHAMSIGLYHHTRYEDVMLHTIPLFHANGWGAAHTITFVGGTHVMLPRFLPEEVFRLVQSERVGALTLVPIMAAALVNSPARSKYDLSSVEWATIGGAASSPTLIREVEQTLGFSCYSGYGLTECSPSLSNAELRPDIQCTLEERYKLQAMTGYAFPGCELRVVDANDNDVARDGQTMGEIIARSDGVMAGYWRQPEATAEAMRGGWFHTGDVAVFEENGYIRIVDRKKDIIVSGGENISSLDVEQTLLAHPAVYEAAVIPASDQKWGEVPRAVVVTKPGSKVSESELIDFCRARLAHYKCPQSSCAKNIKRKSPNEQLSENHKRQRRCNHYHRQPARERSQSRRARRYRCGNRRNQPRPHRESGGSNRRRSHIRSRSRHQRIRQDDLRRSAPKPAPAAT